jgi:putative ABC transport system permease protein
MLIVFSNKFMRFSDIFKTSLKNLKHSKLRSFLTILGIVIGVAAVIILMSLGESAQNYLLNQIKGVGSNLIFVIPGSSASSRFQTPAASLGINITTLKPKDVEALKREPSISGVAPIVNGIGIISYLNKNQKITYQGTNEEFFIIRNFKAEKGRVLTKSDVESGNKVILLGNSLAKTLFENSDPIGKFVRLNNTPFQVVGVLESKGVGVMGVDQNNIAILPVTVAQNELLGITHYNMLFIEASPLYNINFVQNRITSVLRQTHNIGESKDDDFTVRTQEDILSLLGNITSVMTVFLAAIASISLLVGGIGIMNIMLVSVMERTREIGLRKAVGARTKDILNQFLVESALLTFLGGIIGIIVGLFVSFASSFVITNFIKIEGWEFTLPPYAIFLGSGVSILIGIVFGFYPARQAAQKSPIEALRYE